jgi:hypothetical protein
MAGMFDFPRRDGVRYYDRDDDHHDRASMASWPMDRPTSSRRTGYRIPHGCDDPVSSQDHDDHYYGRDRSVYRDVKLDRPPVEFGFRSRTGEVVYDSERPLSPPPRQSSLSMLHEVERSVPSEYRYHQPNYHDHVANATKGTYNSREDKDEIKVLRPPSPLLRSHQHRGDNDADLSHLMKSFSAQMEEKNRQRELEKLHVAPMSSRHTGPTGQQKHVVRYSHQPTDRSPSDWPYSEMMTRPVAAEASVSESVSAAATTVGSSSKLVMPTEEEIRNNEAMQRLLSVVPLKILKLLPLLCQTDDAADNRSQ